MNLSDANYKYSKYKNKYINLKHINSKHINSKHINSKHISLKHNQIGGKKKYVIDTHTYEDYIKFRNENVGKDCEWIYTIIDNSDETRIKIQTDDWVLVTEMDHDESNLNKFHLLAFPKNRELVSIRELTSEHIQLLKKMTELCKEYIVANYNVNINEIEAHCHYPPGVMLLHIHFELTNNRISEDCRKPLREHAVSRIIENLKIDSDYYKKITMEFITKSTEM